MLRDDEEPLETAVLARTHDLVRIEVRGIQQRRILVAKAPLTIGVGVESPMDDAIDLTILGLQTLGQRRTRNRTSHRQGGDGRRKGGKDKRLFHVRHYTKSCPSRLSSPQTVRRSIRSGQRLTRFSISLRSAR